MKRKIYTPLLLTALFMSTLSQTVPGTTANAAKKPALSKTKISVYTGKKAKISIKKIAKKTKVTWKLGNKKVAKSKRKPENHMLLFKEQKRERQHFLHVTNRERKSVNSPAASQFLLQKKLHHKKMRLSHPVRLCLRRHQTGLPL